MATRCCGPRAGALWRWTKKSALLASDMLETMHAANGVGLAAQQVGETLQLTVLDISAIEDRPSTLKVNGDRS